MIFFGPADDILLLIHTFATVNVRLDYTYMPISYQKWVWETEAHINWPAVTCQGSAHSELLP